jgi:integrase
VIHRGSGQWCKKVRGRVFYFGKLADPEAAEARYHRERPYLETGVPVPADVDGLTLRDLCNHFMTWKETQRDNGEIGERHYKELFACCERMLAVFDPNRVASTMTSQDFAKLRDELAKRFGPVRLGNEVQKIRSLFGYAYDAELLDKPVRFGPSFKGPSRRVLRQNKASRPKRLFNRDELLLMLLAASETMEAMILLGVNAGLGNHDVAALRVESLDLQAGWLDYPRCKTGIERRVPLWPETVAALREIIGKRKTGLVFLTRWLNPWNGSLVSQRTNKLLRELGLHRHGVNYYACRHTLQTVGGDAKDPDALRSIMGHVDDSISSHYREGIPDERLQAVTDCVRNWLFGKGGAK